MTTEAYERKKAKEKQRYAENREARIAQVKRYREENLEQARASSRQSHSRHRDANLARKRNRRKEDPDRIRQQARKSYQRHKDTVIQRACDWAKENADRMRLKNQKWKRENPDKVRAAKERRRAREYDAFLEDIDRQILFERDEGICGICKLPVDRDNFHVDHVMPYALGGQHCYSNVQVAHPYCNLSKAAKAA
jgi:HNH endonuclease